MRFRENPFTRQCQTESKKASGFQISYFYWSFSGDTMAVKGLIYTHFTFGAGSAQSVEVRLKAKRNTDTGSNPRCGKGFSPKVSFQCRLSYSVRTAPVCNRMHQHLCARSKSQTLAAIPLFGHTKVLHTPVGTGSAALAAAVPYPGKATRISRTVKEKEVVVF